MMVAARDEKRIVIGAGRRALRELRAAKADLDGARRWGIIDIFGGGLLITTIKHEMVESALDHVRRAMKCLQQLRGEGDQEDYVNKDFFRLGDFAMKSDYLLDNPISDLYVQEKINDLRLRVMVVIRGLEIVLDHMGN